MAARILIADDNEINREFLCGVLGRERHELVEATNGREAVAACRRGSFDLILMDVRMPEVDGIEATRQIRSLPGFEAVPVLALTADLQLRQDQAFAAQGFSALLLKPVSRDALLAAIGEHLGETPGEAAARAGVAEHSPVDYRSALAAAGGNPELLARLTEMLGREVADVAPVLDADLAAGRRAAAAERIHKLRASAGYCGAHRLRDAAEELERTLRAGESQLEPALAAFRRACEELQQHLIRGVRPGG